MGFNVASDKTLNIPGFVSIKNLYTAGDGGAVNNSGTLNITDSDFFGNYSNKYGGAIHNDTNGTLNITNGITFTGNGNYSKRRGEKWYRLPIRHTLCYWKKTPSIGTVFYWLIIASIF